MSGSHEGEIADREVEQCGEREFDPVVAMKSFKLNQPRGKHIRDLEQTITFWNKKVKSLTTKLKKYRGAVSKCTRAEELRLELAEAQREANSRVAQLSLLKPQKQTSLSA